jgi:uncharacterized membrane protein YhaH (DUF805 family)
MLSAVFSFQGRLNRLQYFLGAVGLGVAEFVFVLVAGAFAVVFRQQFGLIPMALLGLFVLVVVLPAVMWIGFSLQARRFRDIGWEPVFVIPAWIAVMALDLWIAQSGPKLPMLPFAGPTILGRLINLGMVCCLLFWPGNKYGDEFLEPESGQTSASPAPAQPVRRAVPAAPAVTGFGRRGLT